MDRDVTASPSWKRLSELARTPYDLTAGEAVGAAGRIDRLRTDCAGLRLLYATQRLDDRVLGALQEFADEHRLVARFRAMRRGAVVNRIEGWESENRQALHTSCRDIFTEPACEAQSAGQARRELDKLAAFLAELDRGTVAGPGGAAFTTMVNVGIGGSDLGPRAVYEALKAYNLPDRTVRFVANVDPDDAAAVLDGLDLDRTLVTVVSKSGSTLETRTNEGLVRDRFHRAGLDPARHCVAVTGSGSPMEDPSRYLRSFSMYDYIGGRYSVTSMVGCVSLGFALGMEQLRRFLRGANEIDEACEEQQAADNIGLLLALIGIWNRNFLGYPTLAVLPYSQALHRFTAHLQQCDMESNGKSVTISGRPVRAGTGPIVWGEPGTNGQHAFYQLLHQGTEIVPVEFIGFRDSQHRRDLVVDGTTSQQKLVANMLAQAVALATGKIDANPNRCFPGNRPSSIIFADRLDPVTMGRLLALYEAKIVYQGFAWNINSFDQEGVELGKVLARHILDHMATPEKPPSDLTRDLLEALEK